MQCSRINRIAVIPIDNRPICYDVIGDILSIDNRVELFLPDISLLGSLNTSSDINGLFDFINNLPPVDCFVIALDTLAYGGLINSRRCEDSLETIKNRIEKLRNLIPKNSKVLAFSSIMRISNNNINEEEKEYWSQYGKKIFDWSYKSHKTGIDLVPEIPKEIINDYLNTRKRNFEINKFYLKLASDGFFDTLIFSKDDCAEFGLNVKEASALEYLIKRDSITNVFIKTGADEIPLTLLARALSKDEDIKIKPFFLEDDSKNLISKYEDISIKNCVKGQIELAGCEINKFAPITLLINNFKSEQGDLVLGDLVNNTDTAVEFPSSPYFIADVNNANGADCSLIKQLLKTNTNNFFGYCGYNTSANTIGCSLLTAVVKYLALKYNSYNDLAFKKLQFIRLADDWLYQAKYRKYVREHDPDYTSALDDLVSKVNEDTLQISEFLDYYPKKITYTLPWDRSFEIRIKVD